MKRLISVLFLFWPLDAAVVQQFTGAYGSASIQHFSVWFPSGHAINDPSLPIVVYVHGGSWKSGNGFNDPSLGPETCLNTATPICALAERYAVYRFDYTLTLPGDITTQWPAQWQDCDCMLKFLAEQAGVSAPGNPHRIILWGTSAGAQLALVTAMAPHTAFQSNCNHTSVDYSVLGVVATSAPLNLVNATMANANVLQLLGCDPSQGNPECVARAQSASPVSYVAQGLPEIFIQSGFEDQTIPYENQKQLLAAFSALRPPVFSAWEVFGGSNGHTIDLDYSPGCVTPCGSRGRAYASLVAFLVRFFALAGARW